MQRRTLAYCWDLYCVLVFETVAELRNLGNIARRMEGGLPEGKLAAPPIEHTKDNA